MEFVACNNCGSVKSTGFLNGCDYSTPLKEKTMFTFRLCEECGLIYQNPRPTSSVIGKYYSETYGPHNTKKHSVFGFDILPRINFERDCVLKYKRGGNLLDVGCANGFFLNEMKKIGNWMLSGVELSPGASQKAREDYGLNVFTGDLFEANFHQNTFDVVTMWNVLEHLYDPSATFQEVWQILESGGFLIIRIPNPESVAAKVFGKYWAGLDLPRHLFLFRRNLLINMAEKAGFVLVDISYWGFMWPTSVKYWHNDLDKHHNSLKSKINPMIYRLSQNFLVRLLSFPFWEFINRIGFGENVTFVFKKSKYG